MRRFEWTPMRYRIVSFERMNGSQVVTWWGPRYRGYTVDFDGAGLYSRENAQYIVSDANVVTIDNEPNEIAVPETFEVCQDKPITRFEHPELEFRPARYVRLKDLLDAIENGLKVLR